MKTHQTLVIDELLVGILKLLMWGACLTVSSFLMFVSGLLLAGAWIEWRGKPQSAKACES